MRPHRRGRGSGHEARRAYPHRNDAYEGNRSRGAPREGTRHLIYRGPLRIGEIEETTAVHESGQEYGFRPGLAAMCLRDIECRYPTALLDARFRTVASAIKAIKKTEQQWFEHLPKDKHQQTGRKRKVARMRKAKRP